jgi:polyhydroxyalkanoate synthesis regulator phasin
MCRGRRCQRVSLSLVPVLAPGALDTVLSRSRVRAVMALRENPMLKKMIATGEERMSKFAMQLLSNEKLMGVLQRSISSALEAKAAVEKNTQAILSSLNIPTANDVKKLEGKIEELEKVFEGLANKIDELKKNGSGPTGSAT